MWNVCFNFKQMLLQEYSRVGPLERFSTFSRSRTRQRFHRVSVLQSIRNDGPFSYRTVKKLRNDFNDGKLGYNIRYIHSYNKRNKTMIT